MGKGWLLRILSLPCLKFITFSSPWIYIYNYHPLEKSWFNSTNLKSHSLRIMLKIMEAQEAGHTKASRRGPCCHQEERARERSGESGMRTGIWKKAALRVTGRPRRRSQPGLLFQGWPWLWHHLWLCSVHEEKDGFSGRAFCSTHLEDWHLILYSSINSTLIWRQFFPSSVTSLKMEGVQNFLCQKEKKPYIVSLFNERKNKMELNWIERWHEGNGHGAKGGDTGVI